MPDNESDHTKNTAQFQAFADKVETEQPRSRSGVLVVVGVLAVLVIAAAVAWLAL